MKLLSLAGVAAALALSSCVSTPNTRNHWHLESIGPRISYHALGYIPDQDGEDIAGLRNRFEQDARNIMRTLQRHVMMDNPDNPLLPRPTPKIEWPEPPDVEFTVND